MDSKTTSTQGSQLKVRRTKKSEITKSNESNSSFEKVNNDSHHASKDGDSRLNDQSSTNDNEEDQNEVLTSQSDEPLPPQNQSNDDEESIKSSDLAKELPSKTTSFDKFSLFCQRFIARIIVLLAFLLLVVSCFFPDTTSNGTEWRSKVDPNNALTTAQLNTVRASLKLILDRSPGKEATSDEDTVSTLLVLSSNEEYAATVARCILKLVNTETIKNSISTEINLNQYRSDKVRLDSDLRSLLGEGNSVRAVLLRHIDNNLSNDGFEQLRLLFAYCDGENPVISNRLIIMTAKSNTLNESELRENFKNYWPNEHDFIDALMSRISGHTINVKKMSVPMC